MRARLGNDTLGSVGMAAIDSGVRICFGQPSAVPKEVVESPASCTLRCTGSSLGTDTIFQVKYPHFGISGTGHDGPIIRVGHELDGENVGTVASADAGVESERFCLVLRIVLPDVEVCIVRARGKQSTAR